MHKYPKLVFCVNGSFAILRGKNETRSRFEWVPEEDARTKLYQPSAPAREGLALTGAEGW
jgi:hypothetical protein